VSALLNRNRDPNQAMLQDIQKGFASVWDSINSSKAHVVRTIEDAVQFVEDFAEGSDEVQVFVTGSLHLVGGTLSILEGVHTPVSPHSRMPSQDVAFRDGQT